jgi:hypothetical protein
MRYCTLQIELLSLKGGQCLAGPLLYAPVKIGIAFIQPRQGPGIDVVQVDLSGRRGGVRIGILRIGRNTKYEQG